MKTNDTAPLPGMPDPEETIFNEQMPESEAPDLPARNTGAEDGGNADAEQLSGQETDGGEEAGNPDSADTDSAPQADPLSGDPGPSAESAPAAGRPDLPPAVYCYGLTKTYGAVTALGDLSISLPAGKVIGLLGPNGSGKTTLIKILAGLLIPTSGEALVCGEKPGASSKAFVSYLPERMYFDPGMKVSECVRLFRDFYADFDERRAAYLLSVMDVSPDRRLKTLSKGTKEKVQLILVMSRRAKLYLLDEPIGGVDPAARDLILSTIVREHEREATVLISTHLIRDVEPVLDGFVFLNGGKCVMSGEVETIRKQTGKTLDELFREVFRCS